MLSGQVYRKFHVECLRRKRGKKSCLSLINPLHVGGNYACHMILRLYRTTVLTGAVFLSQKRETFSYVRLI